VSLKKALIIPDTHRPFHSRKAYALMIEVASYVGVDEIVLLGDYADFYSVSRHLRDPRLPHMLHEEVESVNEGLDQLDKLFPKAKKVFLCGNHEVRLETYLCDRAPALFGITTIEGLFRLEQRPRWSFQGFGRNQAYRVLGSDLYARHRPLASNPKTSLIRAGISNCYGDIHKIEVAHAVTLDKKAIVGFCPGWLGDPRLHAFDYMLAPPQWQHGFAFVYSSGSSKEFDHEIIQIKRDFSCVTHGKRFKA
jgi:predicted MPP superfamily phosphohydrolase